MRTQSFLTVLIVAVTTALAMPSSYVSNPTASRAYILKYCRVQCEQNAAKPRKPYRATFDKALNGDFSALHTVFTDESYHTNDIEWNLIPWHILQVIGDARYADFVLSRPSEERSTLLDLQSPYLMPAQ